VIVQNIPVELRALDQWVTWRYQTAKDGKWTKVPYTEKNLLASSTNPTTWTSIHRAMDAYERGQCDGIGFALHPEDDFVGIDLDHCFDLKARKGEQWAIDIIQKMKSYSEFSPSGEGVRIFVKGTLPNGIAGKKKGNIEIYSAGRYLTVTGHRLKNVPQTIELRETEINELYEKIFAEKPQAKATSNGNGAWNPSDDELLDKAFDARNGDKLKRLFDGDTEGYPSPSEADLALCSLLAFWAADGAQLDRLFRRSALMRAKWDEQHGAQTYGERTIEHAFSGRSEHYDPLRDSANAGRHEEGTHSQNSQNSYSRADLPKPELRPEALYGLAGEIVRAIELYSESDPVAILGNVLTGFGNVIGPTPYARVEETQHHLNIFVVQVGDTAKGRKGTAWSTPRKMFRDVDGEWADKRITGGLSSGEGLVYNVRDPRYQTKPIREDGKIVGNEEVLIDKGEDDKRLLLVEEEFSQALKVMSREGNILSPIIRQAWDHGNLKTLTKNDPNCATGAHISIIAHITRGELLRHLVETEQTNGFANRFCWLLVARSKEIPRPKGVPSEILYPLTRRLGDAIAFGRRVVEMDRDERANGQWDAIYHELSGAKPGLTGALIARAEAQVLRLSCLYALLDKSDVIRAEHQQAGLALWEYCEQSVMAIFGDLTGDPNVDTAKEALRAKGELTLTELHALFGRHATSAEIERVIAVLVRTGLGIVDTTTDDRGRKSITVLRWAAKSANSANSTEQNSQSSQNSQG
jgi:hypothetical protein